MIVTIVAKTSQVSGGTKNLETLEDAGASRLGFIVDTPAAEDSLSAHGRVAGAMAAVVEDPGQVRMLALLGAWGSGKSTVVELLQQRLGVWNPERRVLCFIYDTWLRQSEPPRRAFLEGLIAFLEGKGLTEVAKLRGHWLKKLSELQGEALTTMTATSVELSKAGRVLLPTLLFMPLGWKLIGDGVLRYEDQDDPAKWLVFVLGWLLSAAPLLAALLLVLARWATPAELIGVFTNKPAENRREEKIRNPEPTAIEFQAMFLEIVEAVSASGWRLVLVVDNLDRLPPAEALTLWATLRSFFLDRSPDGKVIDRSHLPVVVVPLDPSAPGRIHGNDADASQLSRSFVEKTFDLVFHVPPPVLSRWQAYLRIRLESVFGAAMKPNWVFAVTTIYEAFHRREPERFTITPRSLNAFVNALATEWLQRRDEPLEMASIAFFVCHREEIAKSLHDALQSEVAGIEGFDPDWRLSVAALHFGVPKVQAGELYMEDPIRSAIAAEDVEAFRELAEVPGFDRYLDRILDGPDKPPPMAAARVLQAAKLDGQPWASEAWRKIRRQAPAWLQQGSLQSADDDAVRALVGSLSDAERPTYIQSLGRLWAHAPTEPLLEHGAKYAAAVLARIAQEARKEALEDFSIPLPADVSLFVALLAQDMALEDLKTLRPVRPDAAVTPHLARLIQADETAADAAKAAAKFAEIAGEDTDWTPLLEVVLDLNRFNPPTVAIVMGLLASLAVRLPVFADRTRTLRDQGALNSAWSRIPGNLPAEELAAPLSLMLLVEAAVDPNDGRTWVEMLEQMPDLPALVHHRLLRLGAPTDLAWLGHRLASMSSMTELLKALATERVVGREEEFATPAILEDLPGYFRLLSRGPTAPFWRRVSQLPGFWETLADHPLNESTPLYIALVAADGSKARLGKALKQRLQKVSVGEWSSALYEGAQPWPILEALRALKTSTLVLDGALADVLRGNLSVVLGADLDQRRRWFGLARWLTPKTRTAVIENLLGGLSSVEVPIALSILSTAEANLPEGALFERVPSAPLELLLPHLLSSSEGAAWVLSHAGEIRAWLSKNGRGVQMAFHANLDHGAGLSNDTREQLRLRYGDDGEA